MTAASCTATGSSISPELALESASTNFGYTGPDPVLPEASSAAVPADKPQTAQLLALAADKSATANPALSAATANDTADTAQTAAQTNDSDAAAPAEQQVAVTTEPASRTEQPSKPAIRPLFSKAEPKTETPSIAAETTPAATAAAPTEVATAPTGQVKPTQVASLQPNKPVKPTGGLLGRWLGTPTKAAHETKPRPAATAAPANAARGEKAQEETEEAPAKPKIRTIARSEANRVVTASVAPNKSALQFNDSLPGVRENAGIEIKHRAGIYDDSDIDTHEYDDSDDARVILASAGGLARLAPNGLKVQRESVDVACLKPQLVQVLKAVERHYGRSVVVTSGYRSPSYNRKVSGAKKSLHMYCAAADVQVAGVSKWELAKFFRSMPGRGGVGTYCHTNSVHIDVGPERDWNWRCRRRG